MFMQAIQDSWSMRQWMFRQARRGSGSFRHCKNGKMLYSYSLRSCHQQLLTLAGLTQQKSAKAAHETFLFDLLLLEVSVRRRSQVSLIGQSVEQGETMIQTLAEIVAATVGRARRRLVSRPGPTVFKRELWVSHLVDAILPLLSCTVLSNCRNHEKFR